MAILDGTTRMMVSTAEETRRPHTDAPRGKAQRTPPRGAIGRKERVDGTHRSEVGGGQKLGVGFGFLHASGDELHRLVGWHVIENPSQ